MARPIVELCLSLPVSLTYSLPRAKQLLRHAMLHYLPELLLQRNNKGSFLTSRICRGIMLHRDKLELFLKNPVLADLGLMSPRVFLDHIQHIALGSRPLDPFTYAALSLETWFSAKDGRYGKAYQ